jgi:hypothetical protein
MGSALSSLSPLEQFFASFSFPMCNPLVWNLVRVPFLTPQGPLSMQRTTEIPMMSIFNEVFWNFVEVWKCISFVEISCYFFTRSLKKKWCCHFSFFFLVVRATTSISKNFQIKNKNSCDRNPYVLTELWFIQY